MTIEELKARLQAELPELMSQDQRFREWLEQLIRRTAVTPETFDARFERIMQELADDRAERRREREKQSSEWEEHKREWKEWGARFDMHVEEQNRKWEEQNRKWDEQNCANQKLLEKIALSGSRFDAHVEEQNRKWDEQNRKWDEQNRKWDEQNRKWDEQNRANQKLLEEIALSGSRFDAHVEEQNRKWDEQNRANQKLLEEIALSRSRQEQGISAMGSRWGVASEHSFRDALKGILEKSFGVQVLNINEFDDEGLVFGRPDQVEIDIIVKNGDMILCELKSSMSKGDMYIFDRKVQYYERRHQRPVQRKLVISPMVHPTARPVAERLGIEVFSYVEDATGL